MFAAQFLYSEQCCDRCSLYVWCKSVMFAVSCVVNQLGVYWKSIVNPLCACCILVVYLQWIHNRKIWPICDLLWAPKHIKHLPKDLFLHLLKIVTIEQAVGTVTIMLQSDQIYLVKSLNNSWTLHMWLNVISLKHLTWIYNSSNL